MPTTFGWFSDAPSFASRWKRRPTSSGLSACRRLTATSRSRRSSRARKTVAIPPDPSLFCTRYRPAINSPVIPTGICRFSPPSGGAANERAGLDELDERPRAESSAAAHGHEADLLVGALELVQQRRDQPRAGGAERVPERHRATVHVDAVHVGLELAPPRGHDRGERLVDLDEVDVAHLHAV